MHTKPRLFGSTAERKVKVESFPDIKPRRGVIALSSPETSTKLDTDTVVTSFQRADVGTPKFRSRDQIRQAAGRSGGVFETAVDATTSCQLQYAILREHEEVITTSSKTFSLELDVAEIDEENATPQVSIAKHGNKATVKNAGHKHGELRFFGARGRQTMPLKSAEIRHRPSPTPIELVVKNHRESNCRKEIESSTNVVVHFASKSPQIECPFKSTLQEDIETRPPTTKHVPLLHNDEDIPTSLVTCYPVRASIGVKLNSMPDNADERLFCMPYTGVSDMVTESVERIAKRHSFDIDELLWSGCEGGHTSAINEGLGHDPQAWHGDLVSKWSGTTFPTDNPTPTCTLECCVSAMSMRSAHLMSTVRPLLSSLESTQSPDYASFRNQFCYLPDQGHGYVQVYDQVMHELTEIVYQEVQEGEDEDNGRTTSLTLSENEESEKRVEKMGWRICDRYFTIGKKLTDYCVERSVRMISTDARQWEESD